MPSRHAYLRRARHWVANRGWRGLSEQILWRARLLLQGKPIPGRPGPETGPHPFDIAYHVDTAGLLWGEALDETAGDKRSKYWATGYYGIAPSTFNAALDRLALDWRCFSFVDIGCGKGRALMLALRLPFRRVLGVELSPALFVRAQINLATFAAPWRHRGTPATALLADATTFPVPAGPIVVFLYHPFAAPVMARFLAHLREAALAEPREIYLLYANPELASQVLAVPGMTLLWTGNFPLSVEDGDADRFGSHDEIFAAYRLEVARESNDA